MALNVVPISGQSLNVSRAPIAGNFNTIDIAFSVDHQDYDLGGGATQGKHKQVTMQALAAFPTYAAGENYIFSKLLSGVNEVYVHSGGTPSAKTIPFTASTISTTHPVTGLSDGWTWLPSGIMLKWGIATKNGYASVTLPLPYPPNGLLNVLLTPYDVSIGYLNTSVRLVDLVDNHTFRVFASVNGAAGSMNFAYLAIGY